MSKKIRLTKKSLVVSGVFLTSLGLVCWLPLVNLDLSSQNAVGLFFGFCLGLTFFLPGILRLIKALSMHTPSSAPQNEEVDQTTFDLTEHETDRNTTPKLILYVAFSPIVPLCIAVITQLSCHFLGFGFGLSCHGGGYGDVFAYYGFLGWLISLPIAGMMKLVHSTFNL